MDMEDIYLSGSLPDWIFELYQEVAIFLESHKEKRLKVCLTPAPIKQFAGHMIRRSYEYPPDYISRFYKEYTSRFQRCNFEKALTELIAGKRTANNFHDKLLRELIHLHLDRGYEYEYDGFEFIYEANPHYQLFIDDYYNHTD